MSDPGSAERTCRYCGNPVPPSRTFCGACGRSVSESPVPDPAHFAGGGEADEGLDPMSPVVRFFDAMLARLRSVLSDAFFLENEKALERWASFATPAAAVVGAALLTVAAIRTDRLSLLLLALVWLALVLSLYYVGSRCLPICRQAVMGARTAITNTVLLDLFALVFALALMGVFSFGVYAAIESSSWAPLLTALGISITLAYYAALLLHPQLVAVDVMPKATPAEDAITLFVLSTKCTVRMASIVFGSGATLGAIGLAWGLVDLLRGEDAYAIGLALEGAGSLLPGVLLVLGGLSFPLVAYVVFVLVVVSAEIMRAVLSLLPRSN